jgi:mannose-6-phosphate isomerase-like protein (cupin superfamily)
MTFHTTTVLLASCVLAAYAVPTAAQSAPPTAQAAAHAASTIVAHAASLNWTDGPGSLPAGAQVVVLQGNPAEAGPLMLRLRFPANYRIPPHFHPVIEHVTVLSGTLYIGMGEEVDRSKAVALPAGSFGVVPVEHAHYAFTTNEPVTIQLHSTGPWGVTYVNPADDPRKR